MAIVNGKFAKFSTKPTVLEIPSQVKESVQAPTPVAATTPSAPSIEIPMLIPMFRSGMLN
jgi:hypothetical protein